MTINLGGVPIQDVRVAGVQAQRVMLGTGSTAVEVWSAKPTPVFFAEFPSDDLLKNSGSAGGQFQINGGSISARPPYGAFIPENTDLAVLHSEATSGGYTVMGWFKSSKALTDATVVGAQIGNSFLSFAQTSDAPSGELRVRAAVQSYEDAPIPGVNARTGIWFHLAASLEPSGNQTRYTAYVNGEQKLTGTVDGPMPLDPSILLTIAPGWEGDAGRVRMFVGGALTPEQVKGFYDAERDIYPLPPVVTRPVSRIWMPYTTSLTQQAGELKPTVTGTALNTSAVISDGGKNCGRYDSYRQSFPLSDNWSSGAMVMLWAKHTMSQTSGGKDFFHRAVASGTIYYELYLATNPAVGSFYAGMKWNNVWWECAASGGPKINDGNWHHIGAGFSRDPFNSSVFTISVWIDGVQYGSSTKSGLSTSGSFGSAPCYVMGNRNTPSWKGLVDDFQIFSNYSSQTFVDAHAAGRS